jgi:nucleotide-binding universal stress UspA family protein
MKILIAVDDSIWSATVIERVENTIWPCDAQVRLVTVIDAGEGYAQYNESAIASATDDRSLVLAEFQDRLKSAGTSIHSDVLIGNPLEEILTLAGNWKADLIVLGCRGKRGFGELLLGSVAMNVLLRAPCSVEIVKGRYAPRGHLKVLIAYDGSSYADKAVQAVLAGSWASEIRIKLLAVVPPLLEELFGLDKLDSFDPDELHLFDHAKPEPSVLSKMGARLRELNETFGRKHVSFAMIRGDAREAILAQAEEWQAHLIVMGSHGRVGIARFLVGSVAQAVSMYADCSVRIIR